jgi:hypothetical protein
VVAVIVGAREPQQIGSGLEAGKGAVEVGSCPLREVLARVLAEHPGPATGFQIAAQEKLSPRCSLNVPSVTRAQRAAMEGSTDCTATSGRNRGMGGAPGGGGGGNGGVNGAGVGGGTGCTSGGGAGGTDECRNQLFCEPSETTPGNKK